MDPGPHHVVNDSTETHGIPSLRSSKQATLKDEPDDDRRYHPRQAGRRVKCCRSERPAICKEVVIQMRDSFTNNRRANEEIKLLESYLSLEQLLPIRVVQFSHLLDRGR